MAKRQIDHRSSSIKRFLLISLAAFLFLPSTLHAESLVLVRIIDEVESINLSELQEAKLSAALKTDGKGDMVVRCFNLFSIPVAQKPFSGGSALQKFAERAEFQVGQRKKAVYVKLAVNF